MALLMGACGLQGGVTVEDSEEWQGYIDAAMAVDPEMERLGRDGIIDMAVSMCKEARKEGLGSRAAMIGYFDERYARAGIATDDTAKFIALLLKLDEVSGDCTV